jgi:hypothetical protein
MVMDEDRKKKLLAKLRKCLALSKSAEPHEAAAALRQAQKLAAELNLTEADLEGLDGPEVADTVVKTREGFGKCRVMSVLSGMLSEVFAVKAVFERNPGSAARLNVRYIGPPGRVMLAEYAHKVVWRAMQQSWDALLAREPDLKGDAGKRQAFHLGWLKMVRTKVQAIAPTEAEEQAIERLCKRIYGGGLVTQEHKKKNLDVGAYLAGVAAAADFELHRPMDQQQRELEHQR